MFLGYAKVGRVTIGSHVFIRAGSIILPNVKIGDNVIVRAESVATKDISADSLALGNPAKVHYSLQEYWKKQKFNENKPNL